MTEDIYSILILLFVVFGGGLLFEYLSNKNFLSREISRKFFHIIAVQSAAVSVIIISDYSILLIIAALAVIATYFIVKANLMPGISSRKSWGIFFFPLAFWTALLFNFPKELIFYSFSLLAWSDSFAAIFGYKFAKKNFNITSDKKSFLGSACFFASALILLLILSDKVSIGIAPAISTMHLSNLEFFTSIILISLLLTITEALLSNGFDNFVIPLMALFLIHVLLGNSGNLILIDFITGFALAAAIAFLSYRAKFLTLSGSISTLLLASFIFGFGGWKWSLPIMSFFILSSLLSKIRKNRNKKVELFFEKSGVRDHWQVAANGGIGGFLVIMYFLNPQEIYYYSYVWFLAAVCADTWATEIGTLRKAKTYNIMNFKPIEQGVSGGISFIGSIGALLGAFVISVSAIYWINLDVGLFILLTIFAGTMGGFFDSFLGAKFQLQMECKVCGKITEREIHCEQKANYYRGFSWLNNDMVNFFAGTFSLILALIYFGNC